MEELLSEFYSNSTVPVWSAFLLGLMTAISPCPLASNITAIGFVSKDISNKNRVFINGLIYTFGRGFSYTALALILYFGSDQFRLSSVFQLYGEKFIGPLLILIGLFMFGLVPLKFIGVNKFIGRFQRKTSYKFIDVFLLGVVLALAFCPYSGVLYFGMLIPITIQKASGLYLPIVFAVATGIPVILFAWFLAYSMTGVGKIYVRLKNFEQVFRKIIASVFIVIGAYYSYLIWF